MGEPPMKGQRYFKEGSGERRKLGEYQPFNDDGMFNMNVYIFLARKG